MMPAGTQKKAPYKFKNNTVLQEEYSKTHFLSPSGGLKCSIHTVAKSVFYALAINIPFKSAFTFIPQEFAEKNILLIIPF